MGREVDKILEEALRLPPEARAAVAGRLIESLDGDVDEDAEGAWNAEIARRLGELDSGSVRTIPWDEARRLILGSTDAVRRR
ncbi:MAG: addiction module protein [Thermoanaerobaculia bacterium]